MTRSLHFVRNTEWMTLMKVIFFAKTISSHMEKVTLENNYKFMNKYHRAYDGKYQWTMAILVNFELNSPNSHGDKEVAII